jgi:7,8-dihydropterin-6-yl-methyl-4-(beta-D-ribofuranosyl)aminobenzene 5'-phosphate synthase
MKITVLCENGTVLPSLSCEHGLSLHVQRDHDALLFDMGQSDLFAKNAEILGVDLEEVDAAFLSHGHYDHGGGLDCFLKSNEKAPVYLANEAFGSYYSGSERFIGLDKTLQNEKRLIFCKDAVSPLEGLSFLPLNGRPLPETFDQRMLQKKGADFFTDPFDHERYLLLQEKDNRVLIGGCAHKGILNLLEAFSPHVYIGGFHFMRTDPDTPHGRAVLLKAAEKMHQSGTLFYTGHCTGEAQFAVLKDYLGDRLQKMHTGSVIEL